MTDKTMQKVINIRDGDDDELTHKSSKKEKAQYLALCLYSLSGFLFSQLGSLGEISPFTLAFLCAVPYDVTFAVFLSGSIGYFISQGATVALKYFCAMSFLCIIKLITHKRFSFLLQKSAFSISAFFSLLFVNIALLFISGFDLYTFFLYLFESVLCLCAGIFFIKAYKIPLGKIGVSSLTPKDLFCLVLSLCTFVMCASGFEIESISPIRILAFLTIMFTGVYKGAEISSLFGIIFAFSLSINQSERFLFPCVALTSALSGVFSSYGQIVTGVTFFLSFLVSALFFGNDSDILLIVIEAAVACGCFMLIPAKKINELQDLLEKSGMVKNKRVSSKLSSSLKDSAENIFEIAKIIGNISEKLDNVINPEADKLFSYLQQKVCKDCKSKAKCWHKNFASTANDVMAIAGITSRESTVLPLEKRCHRAELLNKSISVAHSEYISDMAMKNKLSEMRKVLVDQFVAMGNFLKEHANRIEGSRIPDNARALNLKTALCDAGIYIDTLAYYTNEDKKVTIEIQVFETDFETDFKKAKTIIELLTKRFFEKPVITTNEIKTTIIFEEKASYQIKVGYFRKPMQDKTLCGDCVSVVSGKHGTRNVVLSDGMGTGSRAAIDSSMTCSIMSKLLEGGFSFNSAMGIVNSAMIMKSTDESLATIDGLSINIYSGKAVFYKAGAAISFIRRDNSIEIIEKQSLPIGIIRNITFARMKADLLPGDIILMVSDGVTATDCSWINDELLAWSTNNMEDLARHIVSLAHLRSDNETRDDITAVAIRISKAF